MLNPAFTKKSLFGTTVIAGFAALMVVSPALAQTPTTPVPPTPQNEARPGSAAAEVPPPASDVVMPNSDDQVEDEGMDGQDGDAAAVEAVVVTGSRIRRDPTNAPAPLIQVNREEFLNTSQPNIVDVLADVPALQSSTTPEDTTGLVLNQGGLSLLNLRGLGTSRTLVLVDGRRHVGAPQGGLQVDIDTIPRLLIESTEVVTGGQSALYGADAVAGVVNFILRRDFEGVEVDASYGQIVQGGDNASKRISALVGHNFFNDRLNVYLHAEYQISDEVRDSDIDYLREGNALLNNDSDSAGVVDGVLDNILISNALTIGRPVGGILNLSNQVRPSTGFIPGTNIVADPDIPVQTCVANTPGVFSSNYVNCFAPDPGVSFVFNPDGSFRPTNFGTFRDQNGYVRTVQIGGDGRPLNTEQSQGSRLPESENARFQVGANLNLTDGVQLFGEAKYVEEDTYFDTQRTFFDIIIQPVTSAAPNGSRQPDFFNPATAGVGSGNVFQIGTDNAYLALNAPALRDMILANRRITYDLNPGTATAPNPNFGNVTGSVADPRARLSIFGDDFPRTQQNHRELERYVVGVRGDRDNLLFLDNFSYELSYTMGKSRNRNQERAVDILRFSNSVDAVIDTAGIVNGKPGEVVCRVQLLQAQGTPALNPLSNGDQGLQRTATSTLAADTPYAANDPVVRGCVPARVFGTGGVSEAAFNYAFAQIEVSHENQQQDLTGFFSGELFDLWGAGPIGVAIGGEYRQEKTEGLGRTRSTAGRLLFLNTGADFAPAKYDVKEAFAEISVPLLKDSPLGYRAEVSAAFRVSDYSTLGEVETFSYQGSYRPTRDFLFRATYGKSVRIPSLADSFSPASQTFVTIADPCNPAALDLLAPTDITRINRVRNCQALLGANYASDPSSPDGRRVLLTRNIGGRNQGNPFLNEEESRSYTFGVGFTPRFAPRLGLTLDYYDIKVNNVIAGIGAQAAANRCVSGDQLDLASCATIFRDPTSLAINDFIQGSINYAAFLAKGMDFTGRYAIETEDLVGRDLGRLSFSIRGNYLIRREDYTNLANPSDATELDSLVIFPRVRFKSSVTYSPIDRLAVTWDWDWQASQELLDSDFANVDPDNRLVEFYETGSFSQHDFSLRYDVNDQVTFRAGVTNAFDAEPAPFLQGGALGVDADADIFDLFGRRYFVGVNVRLGAAAR